MFRSIVGLFLIFHSTVSHTAINFYHEVDKVQFILVGDKFAENIGDAVEANANLFRYVLESTLDAGGLQGRYEIHRLGSDQKITPRILVQYVRDLPMQANETLVVYFAGHGYKNSNGGSAIAMSGGDLHASDLMVAMQQKAVRRTVLLTDICYSPIAVPVPQQTIPTSIRENRLNLMKDLFFRGFGYIHVTASSPDQFAWTSNGTSLFSRQFLQLLNRADYDRLDADKDGHVTWREFFPHWRSAVQEDFKEIKAGSIAAGRNNPELHNSASQTPYAFQLGVRYSISEFATLTGLWLNFNMFYNNVRTLVLFVQVAVENLKDRPINAMFYLKNEQGQYLRSNRPGYSSPSGFWGLKSNVRTMPMDQALSQFLITAPMSSTGLRTGTYTLIPEIELFDVSASPIQSIGRHEFSPAKITID